MAISATLKDYLRKQQVTYKLIPHPRTGSSMDSAQQAHVPGDRLAKAVIIKEEDDYSMVVVPSVDHVDLSLLREEFGHGVELATESDLAVLFPDCAVGAVPPIGPAWGLATYLDESFLTAGPEVFFEAGDHEELLQVSGEQFLKLLGDVRHGHYGCTL